MYFFYFKATFVLNMKKALLYLFFLGLLFLNSCAHALAVSKDSTTKVAIKKNHIENKLNRNNSKKNSFSQNAILVLDYNDDFEDWDSDDYTILLKSKPFSSNLLCFISNQSLKDFTNITFRDTIYNQVNFSRLPRFNYISLRVLRL